MADRKVWDMSNPTEIAKLIRQTERALAWNEEGRRAALNAGNMSRVRIFERNRRNMPSLDYLRSRLVDVSA